MNDFARGFLGLGVTVLVVGLTVQTWNGLVRGSAGHLLARNPDDVNARALLLLN